MACSPCSGRASMSASVPPCGQRRWHRTRGRCLFRMRFRTRARLVGRSIITSTITASARSTMRRRRRCARTGRSELRRRRMGRLELCEQDVLVSTATIKLGPASPKVWAPLRLRMVTSGTICNRCSRHRHLAAGFHGYRHDHWQHQRCPPIEVQVLDLKFDSSWDAEAFDDTHVNPAFNEQEQSVGGGRRKF